MKQLILGLAAVALITGANVASAKTIHHKGYVAAESGLTQRSVSLRAQTPAPNADLKYGPQPDFPQSPAGGGY